ncbi:single-stranded DNA-binding protein [Staphylococcus aureus M1287]|nr:single-stranded DNA-binding protein [Staphylococcus aureus M1287]
MNNREQIQDLYQQQVQQTRGQSQYSNNKPVKDNPFANANGPIELNDDDLPF